MSEESGSEVYTWGQGVLGQLGHSDEKTQRQPRLVVPFLGVHVKQISCCNQHSAVLPESGEIFTFGRAAEAISASLAKGHQSPQKIQNLPL